MRADIDEVTYDLLVSKVALSAKEHIDSDREKNRNRIAIVITAGLTLFIAALTGVATFGFNSLKTTLEGQVDARINAEVPSAMQDSLEKQLPIIEASVRAAAREEIAESIESEILNAQQAWNRITLRAELRERLNQFEDQGGFDDEGMKSIMSTLLELSSDAELLASPDFEELLTKVIVQQAGADRLDLFERMEKAFEARLLESQEASAALALAYGQKAISFPVDVSAMTEGKMKSDWLGALSRFHTYADAARTNRFPEIPYFFDVVLACMQSRSEQEKGALLSRIDEFLEGEVATASRLAHEHVNETWTSPRGPVTALVRERVVSCAESLRVDGLSTRVVDFVNVLKG